jgi:hypothetical protein
VWYFRIVPTVGYLRIVPTVGYLRIVPTVWYYVYLISVLLLNDKLYIVGINIMKSKIYHTLGTILRYPTVGTILRYHTVGTMDCA